jgi:hypothetical protein
MNMPAGAHAARRVALCWKCDVASGDGLLSAGEGD